MSLLSILAMRNWASLVTSRDLFLSLLRIYLVFFSLMFVLAAWGLVVTFGIFNNVDFNKINPVINPYGLFIATVVFLIPYSLVLLYYILDLHYLMEEMEHGTIKEPGKPPKGTMDLTGVTLTNSCGVFLCGIPFMILYQLGEVVHELLSMVCGEYMARTDRWAEERERTRKKGVCYRIIKTLRNRCCCFCCPMGADKGARYGGKIASDDDGEARREREQEASLAGRIPSNTFFYKHNTPSHANPLTLVAQEKKAKEEAEKEMKAKELEEKKRQSEQRELERKRQLEEDDERARQQAERDRIEDERDAASRAEMEEEARRAAEEYAQRMKEQEELEKQRKLAKEKKEADRKAKEEADKKKKAEEEAKKEEVFKPILSLSAFKSHWAKLAPSGSFQCHLKVNNTVLTL